MVWTLIVIRKETDSRSPPVPGCRACRCGQRHMKSNPLKRLALNSALQKNIERSLLSIAERIVIERVGFTMPLAAPGMRATAGNRRAPGSVSFRLRSAPTQKYLRQLPSAPDRSPEPQMELRQRFPDPGYLRMSGANN